MSKPDYGTKERKRIFCSVVGYTIDDLNVGILKLLVSEYYNLLLQLFQREKKTIRSVVAEEIYHGLIFPRAKLYETIHKKLTIYFIACANFLEQILQ